MHYIIDHHEDSKKYDTTLREPKSLQLVGSACTLMAKKMLDSGMLGKRFA